MAESLLIDHSLDKAGKYESLLPQLVALIDDETDVVANCANIMAALKETFGFFWIGIYFVKNYRGEEKLVLGPFQGPVACVHIAKGKGVCGTAWVNREPVIVPDTDLFPGHIACNSASRSEIVVPVIKDDSVRAVIDVDSDRLNDFDDTDRKYLVQVSQLIARFL
jgi:GAF domain-containing protein